MIKKIFLISVFSLFVLSSELYAKEYVVGVETTAYYPQYEIDEKGQFGGYARAVLDAFAVKNGHTFVYLPFPIRRLFTMYLNNQGILDLKYPDNPLWDQEEKKGIAIKYSEPMVRYIDGVLVADSIKGKGLKSLTSISMVRGFTPIGFEDKIKANEIAVSESNTSGAALQMVLDGRAQGVYGNIAVYSYLLDKLNLKYALRYDPALPHDDDHYYLSSFKHPELIVEFDKFLEEEKDMIVQLKAKYKVEDGFK